MVDEFEVSGWSVRVYKSTEGNYLFLSTNDSLGDWNIVDPKQQRIGKPSTSHMYISRSVAFNKESPLPVAWGDESNYMNPNVNLVVDGSRIAFTTYQGLRIEVDTSKY